MLLGGLILSGQTLGVDIQSWRDHELNGQAPFQAKTTLDAGYGDASSITNWDRFGSHVGRDYKFVRKEILTLVVGIAGADFSSWSSLSAQEKEIAARWFCAPAALRQTIYSIDDLIALGMEYHKQSVESRVRRFRRATMEVYNRLTKSEAQTVAGDIAADALAEKYAQFGIEGTSEGDTTGLYDYLEATSTYGSTGLAAKGYVPTGATLPDLVSTVMSILRVGDF